VLPVLHLFWDYRRQLVYRLPVPGQLVLGTTARADLRLPDPAVSALHAVLLVDAQGQVRLLDLHSRNGTYVNGQRVHREQALASGALLQLGYITAVLLLTPEPDERPHGRAADTAP
jgi:pSer/pThr/pTyr-binding forkhead associated (FHA) protein